MSIDSKIIEFEIAVTAWAALFLEAHCVELVKQ